MPLPAGFAELLLEELGRPALVFEGRNVCLANKLAIQRWGDPPKPAAPPNFLAPHEWEQLRKLLSDAEKSIDPVIRRVALCGVPYSARCTVSPNCPFLILCVIYMDIHANQNANVQEETDPVAVDAPFSNDRTRDLCMRQLLERTHLWFVTPLNTRHLFLQCGLH